MLESIRNFVQLTSNIGTAGQPQADQIKDIADAGYQAVINIAMPNHPDSFDNEDALVTSLGMHYYHIPVPFDAPKTEHVQQFCRLMQTLENQQVFVHCIMNYRVSAFMFHYLHHLKDYPVEQARSPMFERWQIEPQWQAIMELTADDLDNRVSK
jgi:protein tyrosine phosphatase (PTP) superfamily phosphohydrolase (DUF442 family)